ncbi:MAG: DUF2868 domain-containing protein [Epsilonproteobacteria bacterium]|nr:DUF2868 domain-containing protein [Campylobacterota bacterium]
MQTKNLNLSIKSYFDMSQLLQKYRGSHKENRELALQEERLQKAPVKLLLKWLDKNLYRVTTELNSKKYLEYLSSFNSALGLFSFVFGFLVGVGLLSYSGESPVNIVYYLLIVVFMPLFSMFVSLLSIIFPGKVGNFFTMLFPLHWIEKLVKAIAFRNKMDEFEIPFSSKFTKIFFIERVQLFSLIFSIGILISLVVMVVATDIAFGWSTTLQISVDAFHKFINYIGIWWAKIFPSAIPSLELIDMSHYFRLGAKVDNSMVENADKLGAWWKFLAMSTLFYSIILRFLFWLFTKELLHKQLEKEFLSLDGVSKILKEFNRPFVSTVAPKPERHLDIKKSTKERITPKKKEEYSTLLGWNYSIDEIKLINDATGVVVENMLEVGGSNSFTQDSGIANSLKGKVILYVKSWEPPTMDFIDFLEMVIDNSAVTKIEIYPLGTVGKYYKSNPKDIAVWERKIDTLKSDKVWIIDNE